ncbi:MAG: SMC-Scp complex subunit ScpB [Armatimonadota bacterium]|nr:SMC-Scp complex subunit ScpB [Armatimonadota bacterium]MDW8105338.1 SMC-Scp complex subunit ScpB [Armatimonadota bacterium]MDW8289461.1 SMC-Scp complex subunit ScpB [Armatimonadota bacterium]
MDSLQLSRALECVLFVATEPVPMRTLVEVLQVDEEQVQSALCALEERLLSSGLQLVQLAGGYQLCTRPEFAEVVGRYLQPQPSKLSRAALETVAIIAYRQPITLPEIEAIRGVQSDAVIRTLLQRGLIQEVGRKQAAGRPVLYGTTPQFLHYFGLNSLEELPELEELHPSEGNQPGVTHVDEGASPSEAGGTAGTCDKP